MTRWAAAAALATACATPGDGRWREGALVLVCDPSDAAVTVDGVPRGACREFGRRRRVPLSAGMHRVEVKKEGYEPYETYCEPGGAQATLELKLSPTGR